MGLQDVLYNPESGKIVIPNMGVAIDINDVMDGNVNINDLKKKGAQVPKTDDQNDKVEENTSGKEKQDEDNDQS